MATAQNSSNVKTKLSEFIVFPNKRSTADGAIDEANCKTGVHGLVYLLKNPRDPLLHIFLFESVSLDDVSK